jgi:hypothetical protein
MNDETASGQPEGEALPEPKYSAACKANFSTDKHDFAHLRGRVLDAIELWYAKHFHAAAVAGRTPLSADDKAALQKHVADAVASTPASKE